MKKKANIGDIWVTIIPRLYLDEKTGDMAVSLERRPCLIIDDGRGFIIEENSNYSGLKLTTRQSFAKNVNRTEIKNWKKLGLKKKSYVRIELPIKIENQQLVTKIGTLSEEEVTIYLKDLANFFNTDVLDKLSESEAVKP